MDREANHASAATPDTDSTLCTVRGGARFPGPATSKTVMTADRSTVSIALVATARRCETGRSKAKCMPSCTGMLQEGGNGSARMGTSYVLSAARATACKPRKRALLQSFRYELSRAPDRGVVTVNCGTAVPQPRNMLHKSAFCLRYQAGGRPIGGAEGRSCANELFIRAWRHEQWPIQHRVRLGISSPARPEVRRRHPPRPRDRQST